MIKLLLSRVTASSCATATAAADGDVVGVEGLLHVGVVVVRGGVGAVILLRTNHQI